MYPIRKVNFQMYAERLFQQCKRYYNDSIEIFGYMDDKLSCSMNHYGDYNFSVK